MIAKGTTPNGECRSNGHPSSARSAGRMDSDQRMSSSEPEQPGADRHPLDPLGPLLVHFAELREYLSVYVTALIDRWRIGTHDLALKAAIGTVCALTGMAALIAAAVLLVNGLATAVGILAGGRIWAGQILVGGTLIALVLGGLVIVKRVTQNAEHRSLVEKYEMRKRKERAVSGTNVSERADEPARKK